MVVDLHSLKKDIEEYPNKLRAALLQEHTLEDQVEALQEEIDSLEGSNLAPSSIRPSAYSSPYATLRTDPELMKMRRDMDRIRQRKMVDLAKNPTAYELPSRPTQQVLKAAADSDPEVEALQRKIEEREDLLNQQASMPVVQIDSPLDPATLRELEQKQKELTKMQKALREAHVEREIIERALPIMYELLVQLSQVK